MNDKLTIRTMKIFTVFWFLLLHVLALSTSCGPDHPKSPEKPNGFGEVVVGENETLEIKSKPIEIDSKTENSVKQRTRGSIFNSDPCCSSLESVQRCCCENITKKYENFILSKNYKAANQLKRKDPFWVKCIQIMPEFEQWIAKTDSTAGF